MPLFLKGLGDTMLDFEEWRIDNGYPTREQLDQKHGDPVKAYAEWEAIWNLYGLYCEAMEDAE